MLLELLLYGSFFYDLNSKRRNCMNELLFFTLGLLIGGLTGVTIGPSIGKAICKALGIERGLLYDLFTSRIFTTAVAAYIGYKN